MKPESSCEPAALNRRSPASGLLDGEPESWCMNHIRYVIGCRACCRANIMSDSNLDRPSAKAEGSADEIILRMFAHGIDRAEIAKQLGITRQRVSKVIIEARRVALTPNEKGQR